MKEKDYKILIEETLQRVVNVKANSLDEAIRIVEAKYQEEEIVLDYTDYVDVKINEYNQFKLKPKNNSYGER